MEATVPSKIILLVEDDTVFRLKTVGQLEKRGYGVICVSSGKEAVDAIAAAPSIGLILIDSDLGGMDGFEAARLIRERHDVPVIFLVTNVKDELVDKAGELISYGYVMKNSGIAILDASIKMAFRLQATHNELKEKERLLRISEGRLRKAQAISQVGNVEIDLRTNEIFGSEEALRIYGIEPATPRHILLSLLQQATLPAYRSHLDRAFLRLVKQEGEYEEEFEIARLSDGAIRRIYAKATLIVGDDARPAVVSGVVQDITSRRRAEDAATIDRLRLADAMDLANLVYWERDPVTMEFIFDDTFYAFYGTTAAREGGYRIKGEEFLERFVHHEDRAPLRKFIFDAMLNQDREFVSQFEHRIIRGDGQVRQVLVRTQKFRDGDGHIFRIFGAHQDITDRKKTEQALRESEQLFRSLVETTSDWIWEIDRNGAYAYASQQVEDLLGYTPEEILCKTPFDLMPKNEARRVASIFHNIVRSRKPFSALENVNLHKDGHRVVIETSGTPIFNDLGEYAGYRGFDRDITWRKQAEEALRLTEEKYRKLFSELPYGAALHQLITDEEGRPIDYVTLEANDAFSSVLGVPANVVLEQKASAILPRDELDRWLDIFGPVALSGMSQHYEIYSPANDKYFEGTCYSAGQGKFATVFSDVSDRKRTEHELRMLQHSVEVHPDGAYWIDGDSILVYANRAFCRAVGYTCEELIGKTIDHVNPMATGSQLAAVWERLRREGSFFTKSVHRRNDGSRFPIELVISYVRFDGKEYACGFARDVTEKQGVEEQLRQAQKMEAIGTLAGGVAHDFNNILTVIMGFGHLIQVSIDRTDPMRAYIDEIMASSNRGADLVQNLLAFGRKQSINPQPHPFNAALADCIKLLRRLLPEDIQLVSDLRDDDMVALLDYTQLSQILMNLGTNARDAMPRGGVLTITTERVALDENLNNAPGFGLSGNYAKVSLSDTGIGMDERTLARIFDPFFTTKEVGKGTGLGLASVYGIMQQHRGKVTVSSKPLQGTRFDLLFPLVDSRSSEESAATPSVAKGTETVLVVEDDNAVRGMITSILQSHGYSVLEAANGDDAIRVHREHIGEVSLVITDIVMPEKNGKDAMDVMAYEEPAIKVIYMSGYLGDIMLSKGIEKETVDFLQKPISVSQLLEKVREVIDR